MIITQSNSPAREKSEIKASELEKRMGTLALNSNN